MYLRPDPIIPLPDRVRAAFAERSHITLPELAAVAEVAEKTLRRDLIEGLTPSPP